ncbi:MAG: CDP-alcohol phosphatidyltransferase family protein [Candidatus Cloacimonetes bacterium]|nr:CDP-alcohol phosphatidyltransferase family protein [Candidatus Cloacimonadota bacterium]
MNRNYVTLKSIKNNLTNTKSATDKNRIITPLFRPISYYLTYLLMRVGFSPNKTSLLSFCVGFVGIILLSFPNKYTKILVIICLYIWILLEYCDGNIARVLGKASFAGSIIDNLNTNMIKVLMPIALGINAFLSFDRLFKFTYPLEINIIFGFMVSMLYLLSLYYGELNNKLKMTYCGNITKKNYKRDEVYGEFIEKNKIYTILSLIFKIVMYIESYGNLGLIITITFIFFNMHLYLLLLLVIIRIIMFILKLGGFMYIAIRLSN